ncbi:hypothetical protein SDC9_106465 [bioreactor metagenome]|uniref:Uncharacterized protein n=1 Tax=bioreactor metagenome TaxID=1076179 RepID=A0A645B2E0_9ZZZZ
MSVFRLLIEDSVDIDLHQWWLVIASGFFEHTQFLPVVPGASVVMTAECDCPGRLLNENRRMVAMGIVERTDGEYPLPAALPVAGLTQFGTEASDPAVKIKTADDFAVIFIINDFGLFP